MRSILSILVVVWLLVGAGAAFQRDYFRGEDVSCAKAGTVALTIVAGPLNYVGANPKIDCDELNVDVDVPEPSS